jgi:hypothetical protein
VAGLGDGGRDDRGPAGMPTSATIQEVPVPGVAAPAPRGYTERQDRSAMIPGRTAPSGYIEPVTTAKAKKAGIIVKGRFGGLHRRERRAGMPDISATLEGALLWPQATLDARGDGHM